MPFQSDFTWTFGGDSNTLVYPSTASPGDRATVSFAAGSGLPNIFSYDFLVPPPMWYAVGTTGNVITQYTQFGTIFSVDPRIGPGSSVLEDTTSYIACDTSFTFEIEHQYLADNFASLVTYGALKIVDGANYIEVGRYYDPIVGHCVAVNGMAGGVRMASGTKVDSGSSYTVRIIKFDQYITILVNDVVIYNASAVQNFATFTVWMYMSTGSNTAAISTLFKKHVSTVGVVVYNTIVSNIPAISATRLTLIVPDMPNSGAYEVITFDRYGDLATSHPTLIIDVFGGQNIVSQSSADVDIISDPSVR